MAPDCAPRAFSSPTRAWAELQWCTTAFVAPLASDDFLVHLTRRVHNDVDLDPAGYEGSKRDQVSRGFANRKYGLEKVVHVYASEQKR